MQQHHYQGRLHLSVWPLRLSNVQRQHVPLVHETTDREAVEVLRKLQETVPHRSAQPTRVPFEDRKVSFEPLPRRDCFQGRGRASEQQTPGRVSEAVGGDQSVWWVGCRMGYVQRWGFVQVFVLLFRDVRGVLRYVSG